MRSAVRGLLIVLILTAAFACAFGAEVGILKSSTFNDGKWKIHGPLGGSAKWSKAGVSLRTQRTLLPEGKESWEGCLVLKKPIEVIPGRKYRFQVDAKNSGPVTLGVFEYPWKYSAEILSGPHRVIEGATGWKKHVFEYAPSADGVSHIRPFIRVTGWWKRAEIRNVSFSLLLEKGTISVSTNHFIAYPGGTIGVKLKSSSYPVKLLLYGPSGESGPGGDLGGSAAWTDLFKFALLKNGKPGEEVLVDLRLPDPSIEGSYRLVALDRKIGTAASTRFTVRPQAVAAKMTDLVKRIDLPKGSCVVFLGDSLTHGFPGRNYPSLISRAFKWRFGDSVKVVNAGIGGDNITKIEKRIERDVVGRKPTHVFIFEGANDCKRVYNSKTGDLRGWMVSPEKYEETFRRVVRSIKEKTSASVIVATCAPGNAEILSFFRENARTFEYTCSFFCLPEEIERIVSIQKKAAKEFGLDIVDTHSTLSNYMRARDRKGGTQFLHVDDGVHLSEYGHRETALAFLKYLAGERK